jgi:hypothetical protein
MTLALCGQRSMWTEVYVDGGVLPSDHRRRTERQLSRTQQPRCQGGVLLSDLGRAECLVSSAQQPSCLHRMTSYRMADLVMRAHGTIAPASPWSGQNPGRRCERR